MASTDDTENPKRDITQIENMELHVPQVQWWKQSALRRLYMGMPVLMLAATINGYDGSLLNGLQTMDAWQKSPPIADRFGRRFGTALGIVIMIVGVIIQVLPDANSNMFVGGRFLVGFGSNISIGAAPLLIMELAYPQHRGKLATLYNTMWYVGSIIAAWTVYGTIKYSGNVAWRVPVALQALMPFIQLVGVFFLPESPRWLCSKGRDEEAMAILVKYHAEGNPQDRFVHAEFAEIKRTLQLEKESSKQGWIVFLQTPGNRRRLLLIILTSFFSQCSGNGLVSYYLHDILSSVGITDSTDQSLFNGGLQIWSWLVSIAFSVSLVDRLGRKTLFLIAGVGMLVVFSVWTGCSAAYSQSGDTGAGSAVFAMIFLFYGVAGFAWPGLTVAYSSEILPYGIRAKGLSLCLGVTALSGVLNQYVNPIGLSHLAWKFYFVYIVILVIEILCIWFFFVETKGPTLEEIGRLFDGDDAYIPEIEGTMHHVMKGDEDPPKQCHISYYNLAHNIVTHM
ncbi:hypothetical protein N7456_013630 [Penicillium angulare]|uniref:Major facilitator superfamily (MFS) profile domain-containing protein n=1 Tax=Penicillium angulare TaxID=116970 RepID=A0A9W9EFU3_9EURO|nr:hypothetical protein N7456_013630 [Penicillium angulare]